MSYKLMAVDIDGTLLDSKGNLTDATKEAIRRGVENGLIFTIASGRPIQGIENINRMLDIDLPFITYNGAMVVMGKSKEILYEQKLSPKDTRDIIELGEKYGASVMVWRENALFVPKINERVMEYKKISGVEPVEVKDHDTLVGNGATKVLWYDDVDKIEEYRKEVGKYLSENVNFHPSRPYFLEFVDKNASKAIAMERLGQHFGITREEMIAVGDGYNDLSMIEYAGLGVAMGNSPEDIKKKADYTTLTNDENGVAHVINKFVLA